MVESETEQLTDRLSVEYKPAETTGSLDITVEMDGKTLHSAVVKAAADDSHHGKTQRGQFLNNLKEQVSQSDFDVKGGVVRAHVEGWFEALQQGETELDADLRSELATEIIEGTQEPVEIHGASDNNTTFVVTLMFRGRTNEIEFAADDLLPGSSPGALESALMNQYFERVEVPEEDWDAIAEHWHSHSEVVSVTETTAEGAKADRVLEYLTDSIEPTTDKGHLSNSHRAAFVDKDGEETSSGEPAIWVQDRHYTDEIDSVASVDAKQPICTELRKQDVLKQKSRRRWLDTDGKDRFWAFEPAAVGIDPASFDDVETDGGVEI